MYYKLKFSTLPNNFHPLSVMMRKLSVFNLEPSKFISEYSPLILNVTADQKLKEIEALHAVYRPFDKPSKETILKNVFDLTENEANKLLKKNASLNSISSHHLNYNLNLIKSFIDPCSLKEEKNKWIKFCQKPAITVTHCINIMNDIGIPVTYNNVERLRPISNKTVKHLREKGLIAEDTDIPKKIFDTFEAPQSVLDILPSRNNYEKVKLRELWSQLLLIFLKWQTGPKNGMFLHQKQHVRIGSKSLAVLFQNIALLKKHFHFNDKMITRYPRLVTGIPSWFEDYSKCEKINNINVRYLIKACPYIMLRPLQYIKAIEALLNYININPKTMMKTVFIFCCFPPTLLSRIEYYIKKTSLTDLRLTPKSIDYFFTFKSHSKKLEAYESEFGAVSLLPCPVFLQAKDRYGLHNVNRMKRRFISRFLNVELDIEPAKVIEGFNQMRFIYYPEFFTIKQNFAFLVNKGYSLEYIKSSFHLLVYPHEIVVETLEKEVLNSKYGMLYMKTNDVDKLLQLLLYKVHKLYINMGGAMDF